MTSFGDNLKNSIWPRSVPLWMAAFYVALFIIRPWEQLLPWLDGIHFERSYAILMIAVTFLSSKTRFQMSFQTLTVVVFSFGLCLSVVFAWNPSLGWTPLYDYLTLTIFYFILIMVVRTPYELFFMVTCYIVTMTLYLAKAQWEFFMHGQVRFAQGVARLTGIENTFSDPNSLAMSIVTSLPMTLFLWSVRKEISYGWPSFWKKGFPFFLTIYFVLGVGSIILTNSRSGMLSFILFILLATFRGRGIGRKLGYILIGILLLATLWYFVPEENKNRFRTIFNPEAGPSSAAASAQGRWVGFEAGMMMFDRFPLTGVGIGNFRAYREAYWDGKPLNAHNLFGEVLGETGLIGGASFLLMVIVILGNCHKVRVLGGSQSDPISKALSSFGPACRDVIILLVFEGLFGHNLMRFNWFWVAAFSVLALQFARTRILK